MYKYTLVIWYGFYSFADSFHNKHILIQSDSTTAISYIKKYWGGYAIPTSFQNCSPHNLGNSHFAQRIKSNYKSNLASRVLNLLTALFRLVCSYFGQLHQVDLCASHLKKQLKITKVMLQTHLLNMQMLLQPHGSLMICIIITYFLLSIFHPGQCQKYKLTKLM